MPKIFRVLDTETTGMEDAPTDLPVQLAFLDLDVDMKEVPGYFITESFVNPGKPIPSEISAIHHIVDEDVAGAPPWESVSQSLLPMARFDEEIVAYVAHNSRFDAKYVHKDFLGIEPVWIDTFRCALRCWPEAPSHSNQALRYYLKLPCDREIANNAHRAGPDCYVTAHLLIAILEKMPLAECLRVSTIPAILQNVHFGKHWGSRWDDVPVDYLEWCMRQEKMDEDVVWTCRYQIQQRRKKLQQGT